jgi:hypothetical protein
MGTWWWSVICMYATVWLVVGGQGLPVQATTTFAGPHALLFPIKELLAAIAFAVPRTSTVAVVHPCWLAAHRPVSRAIWVRVF